MTKQTFIQKTSGDTPTESVKLSDISKLVNYMKTNNQGPWANNL